MAKKTTKTKKAKPASRKAAPARATSAAKKTAKKAVKKTAAKASAKAPAKKSGKPTKYVYFFGGGKADGDRTMKDTLGGKGANLAEMTNAGLPVPPGFTISTDACRLYYELGRKVPPAIDDEMIANVKKIEKAAGAQLGSVKNPLLVSVRSGAKFSMPGMMDTILNLGLNDETVEGLKARTGNGRFAYDSYRRFIQMYGNVVLEMGKEIFEHEFDGVKKAQGVTQDTELDRRRAQGRRRPLQEAGEGEERQGLPAGSARAAEGLPQRRVPFVEQRARAGIPPHLRHPGFDRHGRQRPGDGVRQHRRSFGHGRGLHAQPGHRREGVLR